NRDVVTQQIELLAGYDARTLIALEQPVVFANAQGSSTSGSQRLGLVEVDAEEVRFSTAANAYRYTASSADPDRVTVADLADVSRYLSLPAGLDSRVAQLAEHVVGKERRPLQVASLLQRHLQRDYTYTLEQTGGADDPLADFLFVKKAG